MIVTLQLADGRRAYTRLDMRDDKDTPLVALGDIFESHPTGWIDGFTNKSFTVGQRLVNIAQIVTAEIAD